jgi:tripartite-type tricarboxylate transporter receptor subunit TctC
MKLTNLGLLLGAAVAASASSQAVAQENFYAGKTIHLIINSGVNNGFDTSGRLLGRHLARHIPGNPTVVVENMPGASGVVALQHIQTAAPKDGTSITIVNPGLVLSVLTDPETVKLDFSKYAWLGSIGGNTRVCFMWGNTGLKSIEDMRKKDNIFMGLTGAGGISDIDQKTLSGVFGIKIKPIAGYDSGGAKRLAMERGEMDGDCAGSSTIAEDWIRDKKVNFVVRFQKEYPTRLGPGIPFSQDIAPDKKELLQLLAAPADLGRPFVLSKEVPADRMKILFTAFDETVIDPQFVADSDKLNEEVTAISGQKLDEMVKALMALPSTVVDSAKKAMKGS